MANTQRSLYCIMKAHIHQSCLGGSESLHEADDSFFSLLPSSLPSVFPPSLPPFPLIIKMAVDIHLLWSDAIVMTQHTLKKCYKLLWVKRHDRLSQSEM